MMKAISLSIKEMEFVGPFDQAVIGDLSEPWVTIDCSEEKKRKDLSMSITGWTVHYDPTVTSDEQARWELRRRAEKDLLIFIGEQKVKELQALREACSAMEALEELKKSSRD